MNYKKNTNSYTSEVKSSSGIKILAAFICMSLLLKIIYESPETIGDDERYTIFVLFLPIVAGIPVVLKLFGGYSLLRGMGLFHIVMVLFLLAILSFLSFGLIADIAFENCNEKAANNSNPITITLPVTEFKAYTGKNSSYHIKFEFNGNEESVLSDEESLEKFENEDLNNIRLQLRKGIWNHYVIDKWEMVH